MEQRIDSSMFTCKSSNTRATNKSFLGVEGEGVDKVVVSYSQACM